MNPKALLKSQLSKIAVEEENLGAIPFAVLERRVGKHVSKVEIRGTKTLMDGTKVDVLWQVQGNSELGLPTERDLDIFVALGILTFQSNFSKTVTFTGRDLARLLAVRTVHGKFYQRIKLAMDRFIPLRFRALTSSDHHEEVKWLNVFQDASFSLDRTTGLSSGSVTWTDKLIESMDSGLFHLLDANYYLELDGLTAKHLYRYLAMAFRKTDFIVIDARKLATEHLGIFKSPKYFSRLMQTLEPVFEQLIRIQVLGSCHVVSTADWELGLRRHPNYMPQSAALFEETVVLSSDGRRQQSAKLLEASSLAKHVWQQALEAASSSIEFNALERAAVLMDSLQQESVTAQVASDIMAASIEGTPHREGPGRDLLDLCEIALEVCRQKRSAGQKLRNGAGLIVKLIRDPQARRRALSESAEQAMRDRFRRREEIALEEHEALQRSRILEYEAYCEDLARRLWRGMPEEERKILRSTTTDALKADGRYERIAPHLREQAVEDRIIADLARKEPPPFERWAMRQTVQQAVLPFSEQHHAVGQIMAESPN